MRPRALPSLLPAATPGRARRAGLVALLAAGATAAALALSPAPRDAAAGEPEPAASASSANELAPAPAWTPAILDAARRIPIQDRGRVKPLDTYAQFTLLQLNHKRSCEGPDGRTLSPIEWLLDVLFRPERARTYPCFVVDSAEVLDSVGLAHEGKKKRDRYSFDDLKGGMARLEGLAMRLEGKESKEQSPVEEEIVALSGSLGVFDALSRSLDFARARLAVDGSPEIAALFDGKKTATLAEVLAKAAALRSLVGAIDPHGGAMHGHGGGDDTTPAGVLRERVLTLADAAGALPIVAPATSASEAATWVTPGHLVVALLEGAQLTPEHVESIEHLSQMAGATSDLPTFEREIVGLQRATERLAERRGEYGKIDLEVRFYRLDPFYRALWLYVFAFLVLAVSWVKPNRWLRRGAWALLLSAVGLQVAGIVIRCILRERPPISTLYETMLFIATLGAAASLVAEAISRRGIALLLAPIVGGLLQFLANRFEVMKGEDTMPQLQAVLDTNFWLAWHVTFINLGYLGGLLAALLGNLHVIGRATGIERDNHDGYRALSKITYGMLCFGLCFSVVGTILGGVWANDSWGRFWGWDPKENGALLICLAQLAILHARLGGFLTPFGLAMAAVGQGCVIAFSWFGVNLLQIGLHSYGFSGGIFTGLMTFYGVEALVLVTGLVTWLRGRPRTA